MLIYWVYNSFTSPKNRKTNKKFILLNFGQGQPGYAVPCIVIISIVIFIANLPTVEIREPSTLGL